LRYLIAIILAVAAVPALAQDMVDATAGWSPPTYGTPVVRYVLQHSINEGAWATVDSTITDTTYTLTISFDDCHRVRVAGVDSLDRQGPYSLPSDSYCPSVDGVGEFNEISISYPIPGLISLSWAGDGSDSYEVQVFFDPASGYSIVETDTATIFPISDGAHRIRMRSSAGAISDTTGGS
jgi:hypothetical protein